MLNLREHEVQEVRDKKPLRQQNGIILLFILLASGNWGGYGNQNGGGFGGGQPIIVNDGGSSMQRGFDQAAVMSGVGNLQSGISALSTQLCGCCCDMQNTVNQGFAGVQQSLCNGFAGVNQGVSNGFAQAEIAANARQMADMNQAFAAQTAMSQGFNGLQAQLAQCCCDNRLATEGLKYTIATENCADRAALSDGIRDLLANQTASTQRILDQLCQDKIDAKNDEIAQLRQELNMKTLAASQASQTAAFQQGLNNEVDALYNRLSNCPVPSVPVYGRQPIFTCRDNSCGCGCGNGSF